MFAVRLENTIALQQTPRELASLPGRDICLWNDIVISDFELAALRAALHGSLVCGTLSSKWVGRKRHEERFIPRTYVPAWYLLKPILSAAPEINIDEEPPVV
ncbi:hypothetical protein DdX_19001 [Ditylenchus destructor]|uniref:Uncharacterized protein n=1 Tax=Ditylenchus destructor TaxID=166010 RepID=A0AAD4QXK3_9BILA|nr:hypothetical protein DdX_19001 [Ditylenchus destructor]